MCDQDRLPTYDDAVHVFVNKEAPILQKFGLQSLNGVLSFHNDFPSPSISICNDSSSLFL